MTNKLQNDNIVHSIQYRKMRNAQTMTEMENSQTRKLSHNPNNLKRMLQEQQKIIPYNPLGVENGCRGVEGGRFSDDNSSVTVFVDNWTVAAVVVGYNNSVTHCEER